MVQEEFFVVSTDRGDEEVVVWSDGLVAIGDEDAVVTGPDDLVPLFAALGLSDDEARRSALDFWQTSLAPLWERWGVRAVK